MEVTPKNDINGHISQEILSQLIQKKSFFLKSLVLKNHLKKCQRCSEIVNIKNYLQQIAGRTKPAESKSHPETSNLHDSVSRIYDSSLSKQEAADFLHHISSCSQCFEYIGFVLEDSLTPIPEEIQQQIAALTDISLAEMVLNKVPPEDSIFQKILSKIKKSVEIIQRFIDLILKPIPIPSPIKQVAFTLLFLTVISGGTYWVLHDDASYWDTFVYDENVPYEYIPTTHTLRSPSGSEEGDLYYFKRQFNIGITEYIMLDYNDAIDDLINLEPSVIELQKSSDMKVLSDIRNYYFYLGLSHFAFSRTQKLDLAPEIRTENRSEAIKYLLKAEQLAQLHDLGKNDREIYFLGLAYGFNGQRDLAIKQLRKIESTSTDYDESLKLIKEWSEE